MLLNLKKKLEKKIKEKNFFFRTKLFYKLETLIQWARNMFWTYISSKYTAHPRSKILRCSKYKILKLKLSFNMQTIFFSTK